MADAHFADVPAMDRAAEAVGRVYEALLRRVVPLSFAKPPAGRRTCAASPNAADWVAVDLGAPRRIDTFKLYFLDGSDGRVVPPASYELESGTVPAARAVRRPGVGRRGVEGQTAAPEVPTGGTVNTGTFRRVWVPKLRVVLTNRGNARSGVTEVEAWRE